MGIEWPGEGTVHQKKDGNEPKRSYIRDHDWLANRTLGKSGGVARAWLTRDEVIFHFYPLKRNLVASNRPSPSLGATFLLRYEFVKSSKGWLVLRCSGRDLGPSALPCRSTLTFRNSPAWIFCPIAFINLSPSPALTVPAGSISIVPFTQVATACGMSSNKARSTPDASGKQSFGK